MHRALGEHEGLMSAITARLCQAEVSYRDTQRYRSTVDGLKAKLAAAEQRSTVVTAECARLDEVRADMLASSERALEKCARSQAQVKVREHRRPLCALSSPRQMAPPTHREW